MSSGPGSGPLPRAENIAGELCATTTRPSPPTATRPPVEPRSARVRARMCRGPHRPAPRRRSGSWRRRRRATTPRMNASPSPVHEIATTRRGRTRPRRQWGCRRRARRPGRSSRPWTWPRQRGRCCRVRPRRLCRGGPLPPGLTSTRSSCRWRGSVTKYSRLDHLESAAVNKPGIRVDDENVLGLLHHGAGEPDRVPGVFGGGDRARESGIPSSPTRRAQPAPTR